MNERVGGLALTLIAAAANAPAQTQISGKLRDKVHPNDVWPQAIKNGDCRLEVGPTLVCNSPACAFPQICSGMNQCSAPPVPLDAGAVTITGLVLPAVSIPSGKQYYAPLPIGTAYPPYALGASIQLRTEGSAGVAPLSIGVHGIEPIEVPESLPRITRDHDFEVTWKAPSAGGAGRIQLILDIAGHGQIAAQIACELPDTGSATIPAPLITALIDRGTAGFPSVSLARRSVGSGSLPQGCVDFAVVSATLRILEVEGVISCNAELPCPQGMACGADLKCN